MALFRFECTFSTHTRQDSSSFNWIWVARIIFFNHSILLVVLLLVSTLKIRLLIVWISSFDIRYFSYDVFRVSMATCWCVAISDLSALTLSAYRSYEVQLRRECNNLIDCFVSPSSWIFPCALPNLFWEFPFVHFSSSHQHFKLSLVGFLQLLTFSLSGQPVSSAQQ